MRILRTLALVAVAALPAALVAPSAVAAPPRASEAAPAPSVSVQPTNVQGMIKKSVDYAAGHEKKWRKAGDIPSSWVLERAFTYEADGHGKNYDPVTTPGQVTTWRILVGLQWREPSGVLDVDTVTFTWKSGKRTGIAFEPEPIYEDLVFVYTANNFTWAWNKMAAWQDRQSFPAFIAPTTFNVRNPLVVPFPKHPSWIFGITMEDGSRGYILVNDKTGKVTFDQESD